MPKPSSTEALSKIIEQLQNLDEGERVRVIRAASTFFDLDAGSIGNRDEKLPPNDPDGMGTHIAKREHEGGAQSYFERKKPKSKLEELAVATRFREQAEKAETSTQAEIKTVIVGARRTFDAHNFRRDLDNARTKGLFMRGTGRDVIQLTSYGQQLVDALPDRQEVKELLPPKGSKKLRKKSRKKAGRKI